MLLSTTVTKFKQIFSNFFAKLSNHLNFFIIILTDIIETLFILFIIFCNLFKIFYSLFEVHISLSTILDNLLRYDNLITIQMFRNLFSRTDIYLLFVIYLTFLISLILTICKCIRKGNHRIRISYHYLVSFH